MSEPIPPFVFNWLERQNPEFARWLQSFRDNISDIIIGSTTNGRLAYFNNDGDLISKDLADLVAGTSNEITVTDDGDGSVTLSLAAAAITATTTVANTDAETTLWTGTIAANTMGAGNVIRINASGIISNDTTSDDITIKVYIGSTEVASYGSSIGNVSNADWHVDAVLTVRSTGASGSVAWRSKTEIVRFMGNEQFDTSIETIDTTAAQDITIKVTWDNAKAANTISIYQGIMQWLN